MEQSQVKANELRIGNLIMDGLTKAILRVAVLDGENITAETPLNKFPLPDGWYCAGIPLTPEVLLKCGFVFRNELQGEGALMDLKNENWRLGAAVGKDYEKNGGGYKFLGAPACQNLFYLHQLQNLFFALTGTELTITE